MTKRTEGFIARMKQQGWICPVPVQWDSLWKLLTENGRREGRSRLPAPLILSGWVYSDDAQKRARFVEHLAWADEHGEADCALNFLESLSPTDWHRA